jgi:hypothetical protein
VFFCYIFFFLLPSSAEALAADERADALAWNGDDPVEPSRVRDWWARVAGRLGGAR